MLNRDVFIVWQDTCSFFLQGLVHQWYLGWQVCECFSPDMAMKLLSNITFWILATLEWKSLFYLFNHIYWVVYTGSIFIIYFLFLMLVFLRWLRDWNFMLGDLVQDDIQYNLTLCLVSNQTSYSYITKMQKIIIVQNVQARYLIGTLSFWNLYLYSS